MSHRDRYLMLVLALLSALGLLAEAVGLIPPELLYAAPALMLFLPLLAGRYVGEERLTRLAGGVSAQRPRSRRASVPAGARRVSAVVPRGGLLIASSLAVRPPPSAAVVR